MNNDFYFLQGLRLANKRREDEERIRKAKAYSRACQRKITKDDLIQFALFVLCCLGLYFVGR